MQEFHRSVQINPNDIQSLMSALRGLKNDKLDLILVSGGGSGYTAEQIVSYLRAKYKHIRAIIPQNAMSAATMIACACDSILMGKQSALGPIDPQMVLRDAHGGMISMAAQEVLAEAEMAKAEISANPRVAPFWALKVQGLPLGFLTSCETASKRSISSVEDWLHVYMQLPKDKAKAIAAWLGDSKTHKSHGKPISAATALGEGLKIDALEDDQHLQDKVLDVFHAATMTLTMTDCVKIVENHEGRGEYSRVQINFYDADRSASGSSGDYSDASAGLSPRVSAGESPASPRRAAVARAAPIPAPVQPASAPPPGSH